MSKLSTKERGTLPLRDFGWPEQRKYPIVDQSDVDAAAKLLGKAPEAMRDRIKRRIIAIANRKKFDLPTAWQSDSDTKNQDSGWQEYAGSLNDQVDDIATAFVAQGVIPWSSVEAVFPDFVLVHQYGAADSRYGDDDEDFVSYTVYPWRYSSVDACWKVPYSYDTSTDEVKFGDPVAVELQTVIKALDGEPDNAHFTVTGSYASLGQSEAAQVWLMQDSASGTSYGTTTAGAANVAAGGDSGSSAPIGAGVGTGTPAGSTNGTSVEPSPITGAGGASDFPPGSFVSWNDGSGNKCMGKVMAYTGDAVPKLRVHRHDSDTHGNLLPRSEEYTELESSQVEAWDPGSDYGVQSANTNPAVALNQDELIQDLVNTTTVVLHQDSMDEKTGVMLVSGIATTANVKNAKNQVYPLEVWQDNMPSLLEKLNQGRLLGEAEHPKDGKMSLDRTCLQFTSLTQDDNQFKFQAKVLPTIPHGKNLQILIQNKVPIDISSRGEGKTLLQSWGGEDNVYVVQKGFKCKAFDAVVAGASPNSTITDHIMQDANPDAPADGQNRTAVQSNTEAEMTPDEIRAMLAESQASVLEAVKGLLQSNGGANVNSGTTAPTAPVAPAMNQSAQAGEGAVQTGPVLTQSQYEELLASNKETQEALIQSRVEEAKSLAPTKFNSAFARVYTKHVDNIMAGDNKPKNLSEFQAALARVNTLMQDIAGDTGALAPANSGVGQSSMPHLWLNRDSAKPTTPREVIDRLVERIPDTLIPGANLTQSEQEQAAQQGLEIPMDSIKTPRRQIRKWLQNIATLQEGTFNGPAAIAALVQMEQGNVSAATNILDQSIPNGATGVGAGGAPTSQIYIFPLILRVFPMLFAQEIASIQPMDRPEGKIFYKDAYRIQVGETETAPDGVVLQDRARIDLGSANPPNPTYADDPGEFQTASLIQLRLAGVPVTAQTKKLAAVWSQEEVQDLRAYHNLDAATELMGDMAIEIAQEWNYVVLAELLNAANSVAAAGQLQFGITPPTGWAVIDWNKQIGHFLTALSNLIFQQRNGEATHIIAGPQAWLALSNAMTLAAMPGGMNPTLYSGLIFTPFADGALAGVKTYKTNLWSGINRNQILVLRKGDTWSDTPYVWAPYATYTSPVLTLSDAFTNKQGIMDRAAHKVVNANATAALTIANAQGVPVPFPTAS